MPFVVTVRVRCASTPHPVAAGPNDASFLNVGGAHSLGFVIASRACGNKDELLFVDTMDEELIGFDMAFTVFPIHSAQGMVVCHLGKAFLALECLEDHLEFCEVLTSALDSFVVLLERGNEPQVQTSRTRLPSVLIMR